MSKRTVCFLMSGASHLPYLITSLRSLRQGNNWTGPIQVYAWPESYPYVKRIQEDPRLDVVAHEREPKYRGRNAQYYHKQQVVASMGADWDVVTYLDCDTLIVKPITELFVVAEKYGFAMTQFNQRMSTGKGTRGRMEQLLRSDRFDHKLIYRAMNEPWPSPNGGVWAAQPDSPVLQTWQEWTWHFIHEFIVDETVLHVVQIPHTEVGEMGVLRDGVYNCSPIEGFCSIPDEDVAIWHGNASCWVRPKRCPKGVKMWWKWYQQCLKENLGGIAEWNDEVVSKNKRLRKYIGSL